MKTIVFSIAGLIGLTAAAASADGNSLTYLEGNDPFYPHLGLARLTTPQWIGEQGVEAAVIISIDDLRETAKWETYLRPVLERLKQIDGRAPASIMCNQSAPNDPQFQAWLKEGVSLEVHTLTHPCPLLGTSGFEAAAQTYHAGVDLLAKIPGNQPVAFRMPCCDSMNSASPRFYAELFSGKSPEGRFLRVDSSVMCLLTSKDASLPREFVMEPGGGERFRKYFPMELVPPRKVTFDRFAGYIEDYPYPYIIGGNCWEFPCAVPSDWEAFNCHGSKNPRTLDDWKASLDAIVLKQGVMTFVLHPHGWSDPQQIVDFIDYVVARHGRRVKFLNFREALERLEKNALAGQSLRTAEEAQNATRIVDLNADGFMDVVLRDGSTLVWNRADARWKTDLSLVAGNIAPGSRGESSTVFGVIAHQIVCIRETPDGASAWRFSGDRWNRSKDLEGGFDTIFNRRPPAQKTILRDLNADGACELLRSEPNKTEIYAWSADAARWQRADFSLPEGIALFDERGQDNGVRFVDLNGDGLDDVLFSNEERYAIHLWAKNVRRDLGWHAGWSHLVRSGTRNADGAGVSTAEWQAETMRHVPPPLVRTGSHPNNGAWFKDGHLVLQNEETAKLEGVVYRRSFKDLIAFDVPPAKSPEESLRSIRVRPGFKVDLVATEPLVVDPVAFEWDGRGRLWVVEMRDYPLGIDGKGKAGGVIKVLEDTDGDGRYDKATPFLESVPFPTGVMPWRNGVLIAAAPDLLYAEDTDGDGHADVRRVLFTGFKPGNQQHRFNGFEYGIDNWIYCANGDSGGTAKSVVTRGTVNISGRDFRFRPESNELQAIEGQTQYGRRCDDWGNWFGNNNPTWLWHYSIPERYVSRNPSVTVKSLKRVLANYPDSTRVFPISAPPIRFNQPQSLNHVTSACSAAPYRDELFGADFSTAVFISEPVHNVVHREIVVRDGIGFTSRRADDEQESEFLASSDNWFRPTMLKTGPDGALYIADMYRFVLEHPEWIAPETQARLDLRAGADQGRIYRVYPEGARLRPIPKLAELNGASLVGALDSPNGWQRTMAQRLLLERNDKSTVPLLVELAGKSPNPKARLHALWILDGMKALSADTVARALHDARPELRAHAVRLSEPFLERGSIALLEALATVVDDPEIAVRYQLALSLGAGSNESAGVLLAHIAGRDGKDPQMRIALLTSAAGHGLTMLDYLVAQPRHSQHPELMAELVRMSAGNGDLPRVLHTVFRLRGEGDSPAALDLQFTTAAAFLDGLEKSGRPFSKLRESAAEEIGQALQPLLALLEKARSTARIENANTDLALIRAAFGLFGRDHLHHDEELQISQQSLAPQIPREIQSAALSALTRLGGEPAAERMLAGWSTHTPALRQEILAVLLTRSEWCRALLDAAANGRIPVAEIAAAQQQTLLNHGDASIRKRSAELFTAGNPDRQKVVARYLALGHLRGDSGRGHEIYRAQCMICHRIKGEGFEVGPDLGMVIGKPLDQLLTGILDPNQAIEPRYFAYSATTKDGRTFNGVVVSETANNLTLRAPGGGEQSLQRSDLREFAATERSPMPEGLEQVITPEQMADLVAYLRAAPSL